MGVSRLMKCKCCGGSMCGGGSLWVGMEEGGHCVRGTDPIVGAPLLLEAAAAVNDEVKRCLTTCVQ
jgi:hypothetical protein